MVRLYDHQVTALNQLKNGSILRGITGSGKSLTALAYYFSKVCGGEVILNNTGEFSIMTQPRDLYIITTAKKRDGLEWEAELSYFLLGKDEDLNFNGNKVVVDSWNNIKKYVNVIGAFFIFDEQRVVGHGSWVKSFLRITKTNKWILLTATPGDTWMDYIPVFIANGFYKNRTEFLRRHVVFSPYSKFPKIQRYLEESRLIRLRNHILVNMEYTKETESHQKEELVKYDKKRYLDTMKNLWNYDKDEPITNGSGLLYSLRKIVNSHISRSNKVRDLIKQHERVVIFYNFDYELDILRSMCKENDFYKAEWNGHIHQPVPKDKTNWVYLVQYAAGCEGWNCIETNTIIFYSLNHSYKVIKQAEGRIDRLNTPFTDLYYYYIYSDADIDKRIKAALRKKEDFNLSAYSKDLFEEIKMG